MARTVLEIIAGSTTSVDGTVTASTRLGTRLREGTARDIIQDLWGEGWTFTRRSPDSYDIATVKPPVGMSYQWNPTKPDPDVADAKEQLSSDWRPVPYDRHDGVFAPIGTKGDIDVGGLTLCERPKEQVDAEHEKRIAGAQQNIDDWAQRTGAAMGGGGSGGMLGQFTGSVSTVDHVHGAQTKTIGGRVPDGWDGATRLPSDMFEHASKVFAERDRLLNALAFPQEGDPLDGVPNPSPDMRARITAKAIENVRAEIANARSCNLPFERVPSSASDTGNAGANDDQKEPAP